MPELPTEYSRGRGRGHRIIIRSHQRAGTFIEPVLRAAIVVKMKNGLTFTKNRTVLRLCNTIPFDLLGSIVTRDLTRKLNCKTPFTMQSSSIVSTLTLDVKDLLSFD